MHVEGIDMVAVRRDRVGPDLEAKSERLNARLTPQAKALVQEAAALSGRSVTDLVAEAAREKALTTIRDHRVWTLNAEQSLAFVRALLDPLEPTTAQRAFAADYREAVAEIVPAPRESDDVTEPLTAPKSA